MPDQRRDPLSDDDKQQQQQQQQQQQKRGRNGKVPSFPDLLVALTALPWIIAQFLILAFCGWCLYIYYVKEKGSAAEIAVFVFVASVICIAQQFVHVLLMLTVRCDGKCDRKKQKVHDDDNDDDDDDDIEAEQRQSLLRRDDVTSSRQHRRGTAGRRQREDVAATAAAADDDDGSKLKPTPARIATMVFLGLSVGLVTIFAGWMLYGCILVFKFPIQHYRGSSVLFYSAGLGWCVWFFFLIFVMCAVPVTLGIGFCCDKSGAPKPAQQEDDDVPEIVESTPVHDDKSGGPTFDDAPPLYTTSTEGSMADERNVGRV